MNGNVIGFRAPCARTSSWWSPGCPGAPPKVQSDELSNAELEVNPGGTKTGSDDAALSSSRVGVKDKLGAAHPGGEGKRAPEGSRIAAGVGSPDGTGVGSPDGAGVVDVLQGPAVKGETI